MPAARYSSSWSSCGPKIWAERSISFGSRPTLAHHSSRIRFLCGQLVRLALAVPDRGVLGDDAEGHLFPAAADEDRERVPDRARVQLGETVDDDRHVAIEIAQARGRGAELVAVLLVIALIPAAADAEDEAAVGDVVEGAGHVGEQVGVAVAVGGDEAADLDPLGDLGHGPEGGPVVEMGAVEIAGEREEVIPVEEGVGAGGVDGLPGLPDLAVGGVLLLDLDPDADGGQAMLLLSG